MTRRSLPRNRFLDAVPEEVLAQHRRSFEDNAFFYPELICAREDTSFFTKLRKELDFAPAWLDNGMPFSRHICLGSDSLLASSPAFRQVIELLAQTFHVEPVRSLVNLYRNGGDWCNLHSDQYDAGHCDINFTIGASFGEERTLLFEEKAYDRRAVARGNADTQKVQISIAQRNGDVHAFGEAVNERWRHGVPRSTRAQGERISIMLWGYRGQHPYKIIQDSLSGAGDDAIFSDTALSLSGKFPHLLPYDPKSSRTPRTCEACNRTKQQLGGKVDLDHRWCCAQCWEEHEAMGWLPRPAEDPQRVTDCLTIQGSQLAVAILAGLKTIEFRKAALPEGWYALHVAKRPIDSAEKRRVEEQWPTAPQEDELPHEAIVGVIRISRPEGEQLAEDCPWAGPGTLHVICAVVALEQTLPARSPGNPLEPWRLSPAAQRSVASLLEGQPIYENAAPTLVPAVRASAGSSTAVMANTASGKVEWSNQRQNDVQPKVVEEQEQKEAAYNAGESSWWHTGSWGRGGDGSAWQAWSAASWSAMPWKSDEDSHAVSTNWSSRWDTADSDWYYSQPAREEHWRSNKDAAADGAQGHWDASIDAPSAAPKSAATRHSRDEDAADSKARMSDSGSSAHDTESKRRNHHMEDSNMRSSDSRNGTREADSRRRHRNTDDADSGTRAPDSRSTVRAAESRRRNHEMDDDDSRAHASDSRSAARDADSRRRNRDIDDEDSRMRSSNSRSGARDFDSRRRNHDIDVEDSKMRSSDSRSSARDADSRRRIHDIGDAESRNRPADSRSSTRHAHSKSEGDSAAADPPPGLEEHRSQAGPRANSARSTPPPYAPPSLERPPPYAPPAVERHTTAQSAGSRASGQHRNNEAKTFQARTGRAGPRGASAMQDAPQGEKSTASTGSTDPWGGTGDPWTMALEQGRAPAKKSSTATANSAWKRYRA